MFGGWYFISDFACYPRKKKDNEQFTIIDGTYIKLNMKAADPYEDAERKLKAAKKVGKIIPKMEH